MAKKTRGSARPAQRRQVQRAPARPVAAQPVRPSEGLSDEEEARAAELEARLVAQERAAQESRVRSRDRSSRFDAEERLGRRAANQSLLEVKAQEEYAYVVRDVRRIVTVAGGLFGIMAVLFVLIQVMGVVKVG